MINKPKILIVYPVENDPQSEILYEEILNKGGHPIMLPFKLEKGNQPLSFLFLENKIKIDDDLQNIKAVYLRGIAVDTPLSIPPYHNEFESAVWRAKFIKENYRIYFIESLLKILAKNNVLVANPISSYMNHNTKAQMFNFLKRNGISIPETFTTNDIEYLNHKLLKGKRYVLKSSSGIGATKRIVFDKFNNSESLIKTPSLFQEEIEGKTVRIHTIGDTVVLALKIIANDIDSRTDTKGFELIRLTDEQKSEVKNANNILDIKFSAWDAIIDKNNRIYLLDCNPGPYIFWIGNYYTRLVLGEFAKYLIAYSKNNSLDEANESVSEVEPDITKINKHDESIIHHITDISKQFSNQKLRY
jgi:hypothetical protein